MIHFFSSYEDYLADWLPRLLAAMKVTALLSVFGFLLALVLGVCLAWGARNERAFIRLPSTALVQVLRAIPLLALLLTLYFGLPSFGLTLSGFQVGVIGLGLSSAAYVAEIVRGGLASLHRGQRESALACGMTPRQAMRFVLLPQAVRTMLPPMVITFVSLLKDSSLCALIATEELMLTARAIASESFEPMKIFLLVGVFYFCVAWPLSMLARHLEKHLGRNLRRVGN